MERFIRALRIGSALAAAALVAACDGFTSPTTARVIGVIETSDPRAAVLDAPDSVRVGAAVSVRVTTYGSGSCTRDAGADLRMSYLLAEITPIDRQQTSGPCTDDLRPYARAVALQFDVAGIATVRVRGRRQARTPDGRDSLVMREKTIVVRP